MLPKVVSYCCCKDSTIRTALMVKLDSKGKGRIGQTKDNVEPVNSLVHFASWSLILLTGCWAAILTQKLWNYGSSFKGVLHICVLILKLQNLSAVGVKLLPLHCGQLKNSSDIWHLYKGERNWRQDEDKPFCHPQGMIVRDKRNWKKS